MKKLTLDLNYCYGIKKFEAEFDFETKGNVFSIYAPNGVMKTSLADTFQDVINERLTKDRRWPENETKRLIRDENNKDLDPKSIFVIEPYNEEFVSDKISTLLANEELKKRYNQIMNEIEKKANNLLQNLKNLTGLKEEEIRQEFSCAFTSDREDFYRALTYVENDINDDKETSLCNVVYTNIFNDTVKSLLDDTEFMNKIEPYMNKYDELLSRSNFFRKGIFTHNNANDIAKNLEKNGFFKAEHSVYLRINGNKTEIDSMKSLELAIQKEMDSILNSDEYKDLFSEIDKKIKRNDDSRNFRKCLEDYPDIIIELKNIGLLQKKLWRQYLIKNREIYEDLLSSYKEGMKEIDNIIEEAESDFSIWHEVINIYNSRFSVPFVVRIDNEVNVKLKNKPPRICFDFLSDPEDKESERKSVDQEELNDSLSNGEKRALYLLNIIFEVEARKRLGQNTLFIIDDIADSFDYKNKYAIIEYLMEIKEQCIFKQIILSHNFDFHRTIFGRLNLRSTNSNLIARKSKDDEVILQEYKDFTPFLQWREDLNKDKIKLIASIPLLRNIAQYSGNDKDKKKLTSLLHVKPDTDNFSVKDLEDLIKRIFYDKEELELSDHDMTVKDFIYEVAQGIAGDSPEQSDLENKIALSIAIRLKAEDFMIEKIDDESFMNSISSNQTISLISKYKEKFPEDKENIKLLEQVNLMTPENIHLNSFMYEPIIDLSDWHLKQLFRKVSDLPN